MYFFISCLHAVFSSISCNTLRRHSPRGRSRGAGVGRGGEGPSDAWGDLDRFEEEDMVINGGINFFQGGQWGDSFLFTCFFPFKGGGVDE